MTRIVRWVQRWGLLILLTSGWGCVGYRNQLRTAAVPPAQQGPILLTPALWTRYRAERLLAGGEEAIQFVAWLHEQGLLVREALVTPELLAVVGREAAGLFPIRACTAARCVDGVVHLRFAGRQNIAIPGSWGQAALAISEDLALALDRPRDAREGYRTWRFTIIGGGMRLNSSWLVKWLADDPRADRDMQVHRLCYHERMADPQRWNDDGECLISVIEERSIPASLLAHQRLDGREIINIQAPGFPRSEDVVLSRTQVTAPCIGEEWDTPEAAMIAGWKAELSALAGRVDAELGAQPSFAELVAQPSWQRCRLESRIREAGEATAYWQPLRQSLQTDPAAALAPGLRYRFCAIYAPRDEWGDLAARLWFAANSGPPDAGEDLIEIIADGLPVLPWGAAEPLNP